MLVYKQLAACCDAACGEHDCDLVADEVGVARIYFMRGASETTETSLALVLALARGRARARVRESRGASPIVSMREGCKLAAAAEKFVANNNN